jgi:hypothetical protein
MPNFSAKPPACRLTAWLAHQAGHGVTNLCCMLFAQVTRHEHQDTSAKDVVKIRPAKPDKAVTHPCGQRPTVGPST